MSNFPLDKGGYHFEAGANTADSTGVAVTCGASGSKGSWVEITSGLTDDVDGFYLWARTLATAGGITYAFDVGIGAAASEVVLVPDLYFEGWRGSGNDHMEQMYLPIRIPAGTRVAVRGAESAASSRQFDFNILFRSAGMMRGGYAGVDAMGISGTTATTVDPGATANTKVITEITSSTSRAYKGLMMTMTALDSSAMLAQTGYADINIGAGGSEVAIVPNLPVCTNAVADQQYPKWWGPFWCDIPASTRLSVGYESTDNVSGSRVRQVALYGIY